MSVKLVNYSKTDDNKNLLEQIAFIARVSNPTNQNNSETAEKLVRYLIKHKHWSPLEMVSVCLEINTTRDIARQILRHRSFSFQEFSQRYADASQLGFEMREARLQDLKNRQNSIETDNLALHSWWENYQKEVIRVCGDAYQFALDKGIAKEQARAVLPEGITMSRMYMNGTLRSWVHYIQLRSDNGTQKEHRDIAIECAEVIEPIFPMIKEFVSV
jgi:thymidylate synthase (FAD)